MGEAYTGMSTFLTSNYMAIIASILVICGIAAAWKFKNRNQPSYRKYIFPSSRKARKKYPRGETRLIIN